MGSDYDPNFASAFVDNNQPSMFKRVPGLGQDPSQNDDASGVGGDSALDKSYFEKLTEDGDGMHG